MKSQSTFFDSRAENWEESCYPAPVRAHLSHLIQEFGVTSGDRLLDVGTGPGVLIPYLRAMVGVSGQVFAFDLSFEMVRQACRKRRASQNMIVRADVHCIPFNNDVFNRVICFAAFPHFIDQARAVREMGRVLRPGGTLVIAHLMSREELARHHATHASVARDVLPDNGQMRSFFSESGFLLPNIVDIPGRYLAMGTKHF